jgi:hypothetical protein
MLVWGIVATYLRPKVTNEWASEAIGVGIGVLALKSMDDACQKSPDRQSAVSVLPEMRQIEPNCRTTIGICPAPNGSFPSGKSPCTTSETTYQ